MKRTIMLIGTLALVLSLGLSSVTTFAQDPDPKEQAIVNGLAWLAGQQQPDGGWLLPEECDRVAHTGLALLKLESRALEGGLDPLDPAYEYAANVQAALDFIMAQKLTMPIGPQPAGNPDGNGDGIGFYWDNGCSNWHVAYNTSIALMALSASKHPELYGDAAQNALDFLAWGQVDEFDPGGNPCGVHRGGWRYMVDNSCTSDNSTSGWITLALGYAQSGAPFGFGLTIPPFVLTELDPWLDVIQNDVNGDGEDGGSMYDPEWGGWENILKTGNLLYEFALVGDTSSPRVQDAVDYIERHWLDMNLDPGWGYLEIVANYHAMFTTMKGLDALGIDLLDLDNDGTPEHDWFAEYVTVLTAQQNPDGSWPGCYWGNDLVCTTWALMTLEKFVPTPRLEVAVDVKPGSCPNPLGIKDKGLLPVAILGSADFDVTQIDPASVYLGWLDPVPNQVFALKWHFEDVATPVEPFIGKELNRMNCTTARGDGYLDLVLHFNVPAVIAMLGPVTDGQVLILPLSGNLLEAYGGTPIVGEDVIWILNKIK